MFKFLRNLALLKILCALSGCAMTDPWRKAQYNHLKPLGLDKAANIWATVMGQTHAKAKRDDIDGFVTSWTPNLMISRAETLAVRGISNAPVPNGGYGYKFLSDKPEKLEILFSGRPDFREYIGHSEIAIMAKAIRRPDTNDIFDLQITHRFKGFNLPAKMSISNDKQGHFGKVSDELGHKVSEGQECLFFLSPTYTRYRKAFPSHTPLEDKYLMLEAFPRFCEQRNGRYSYTETGKDEPILFKADILQLYPPIKQDTTRPKHLSRTNSIALRGEWDIVRVDDYAFNRPFGSISINQHTTQIGLPCGPNLYGGRIVDGKYVSEYGGRYIQQHIEGSRKGCYNAPGYAFAKNLLGGTFYADRQTIWFDGEHMDFIAKRSEKKPSKYGWNDWYKYLKVEACILDHPNIGADKYAGFGWFGRVPNHRIKFALVGDGEQYWTDCKPDYPIEITTVSYSLPFLESKLLEIKSDLHSYDNQYITGGWIQQQTNSIIVSVDPNWAKDNQDIITELSQKHPYIEWREDLPFDEIVVTGQ